MDLHSMESDTTELLSLTYGRKQRGTKEPLDESERGELKSWLKAQHSENEDHGIQSHSVQFSHVRLFATP